MKTRLLLLSMLFYLLILFSCEKDKVDDPTTIQSIPKIATGTYYKNGKVNFIETYEYDSQGRLIKDTWDDSYGSYYETIEYSGNKITSKIYDNNVLDRTNIFSLNEKGLVTARQSDDGYDHGSTYVYDENGYLKNEVYLHGTTTYIYTYTIVDGNTTTMIENSSTKKSVSAAQDRYPKRSMFFKNRLNNTGHENSLKSTSSILSLYTTTYTFLKDSKNTIGKENIGGSMLGKQDKNLTASEASPYKAETCTYSYEYDSKGRVTKQICSPNSFLSYDYVTFTYTE